MKIIVTWYYEDYFGNILILHAKINLSNWKILKGEEHNNEVNTNDISKHLILYKILFHSCLDLYISTSEEWTCDNWFLSVHSKFFMLIREL